MRVFRRRRKRPEAIPQPKGGDYSACMLSRKHLAQLQVELADVAYRFLANESIGRDPPRSEHVRGFVEDFFGLYPARPVIDNTAARNFTIAFGCISWRAASVRV